MKSVVKFMSLALATIIALGSCSHDKVDYIDPNDTSIKNIGYLPIGSMTASVLEETENVESVTRAEGIDINAFDVVIKDQAGNALHEFKYGERPTEPIALEGGVYTIAMSSDVMNGAEWEAPVYAAEKEFVVTASEPIKVDGIKSSGKVIPITMPNSESASVDV